MKKKVVSLLMACVLVFGASTTALAAPSPIVDNTVVTPEQKNEVKNEIAEIGKVEIKDTTTAAAAKAELKEVDANTLSAVITEDVSTRVMLREIEADYNTAMNITSKTEIAPEVKELFTSGIACFGAGLNSDVVGSTVAFEVKPVTESTIAAVPDNFKNIVQIDLGLTVDGNAKAELDVPVAITMPVPAGVSAEGLVILHYHTNTQNYDEKIVPTLNADGTITFAVDQFSTFAFANEEVQAPTWQIWGSHEIPVDAAGNAVAETPATNATSPKTGDVTGIVSVCALMAVAGAAVVVLKRKEA